MEEIAEIEPERNSVEELKAKLGLGGVGTAGPLRSANIAGRKNSAIWKLAKTAAELNKGTVYDGDFDDQMISKEEFHAIQN